MSNNILKKKKGVFKTTESGISQLIEETHFWQEPQNMSTDQQTQMKYAADPPCWYAPVLLETNLFALSPV